MNKHFNFLLVVVSDFLLANCSGKNENVAQANIADSCHFEQCVIKSIDKQPADTIINKPTAIVFFELYNTINKHDGKSSYDSLPEKLKSDNRQTIYRVVDQYGFFTEITRPVLDSLKVNVNEGNFRDSILTFSVDGKPYTIDITSFSEDDGMVYYTPGKKPILWKMKTGSNYCSETDFVFHYFK
jgi:hypothetical protein